MNGPIIPVQAAKAFNTNILFASAVLSQLVSERKVKYSSAKLGGTPMYYLQGQENKLELLYNYLGEKPRRAYDALKEKKVLKDIDCEPWMRVALREINDFSYSFQVENELYWRWYMINEEEAKRLIMPKTVKDIVPVPVRVENKKPVERKDKEMLKQKKLDTVGDEFYNRIIKYFNHNEIKAVGEYVIKKGKEIDFIVETGSKFGVLRYFVKVMNKKRIGENELSLAYNQGQQNKLPVLFLSNGELSKKAEIYLEKNFKGYVIFKKI